MDKTAEHHCLPLPQLLNRLPLPLPQKHLQGEKHDHLVSRT